MKSFSGKLFNIPLGGKTRFSRNSSCSSRLRRTQKVTLPKVGNFYLKVTNFCSLQTVPLLGIPKNPEFIPKTCINYSKTDQTVVIQRRTVKNSEEQSWQFQKSKIKSQIQEMKPTIRPEIWRQWRICLLFLTFADELEEQRGFFKLEDEILSVSWERRKLEVFFRQGECSK